MCIKTLVWNYESFSNNGCKWKWNLGMQVTKSKKHFPNIILKNNKILKFRFSKLSVHLYKWNGKCLCCGETILNYLENSKYFIINDNGCTRPACIYPVWWRSHHRVWRSRGSVILLNKKKFWFKVHWSIAKIGQRKF